MSSYFEQTCGFCGCVCSVEVSFARSYNDTREYQCPECLKPSIVRTSESPTVKVLTARTDGREVAYSQK
ncbi:MAG: hypothetical protein OEY38_24365 [Gammaproteobacteria bacterium]|nr:hypothetical protein [Gammaproteobacteria bacterium]